MMMRPYSLLRTTMAVLALWCAARTQAQDLEFKKLDLDRKVDKTLAKITPEEKKETGVVLKEKTYIEYVINSKDEAERYYGVYRRIHLNEAAAVEQFNKMVLPVASKEGLLMVKARSISRTGAVKEVGIEAVKEIEEEGRLYKILAVEGLEVGGEVELMYLCQSNVSLFGSERVQEEIPLRESELHIVAPEYLVFEGKVYNGKYTKQDTSRAAGKRLVSFRSRQVPALLEEKYAAVRANATRVEYKLAYNERKGGNRVLSWNEAGSRIYTFLHLGQDNSAKDLGKFLGKEKIKSLSEEQAIRAVENYIKTNIALRKDAEDDIAANVLKRKFGTQAGIIRLYIGLYESLNIPFEIVIGCSRYEQQFDREFDTWNFLDKYLLYFPNSKKYLDPENPFLRYGLFDNTLEGTDALYISSETLGKLKTGLATINAIPEVPAGRNYDNIDATVSFSPNVDQMNIKYVRRMGGSQAAHLRPYYFVSNAEDRAKLMTQVLKQATGDDVTVTNVNVTNFNINSPEVEQDFVFSADLSLKSTLERVNNRVLVKVGELIGPQTEMYNERPRQHPIDIGNVHSYTRVIKLQVPEGYRLAGQETLKRNIAFANGDMGFVSNYKLEGKVLTITVEEFYKKVQLPISAYTEFQKVINAAADFNKVTIILEKGSPLSNKQ
jgi:hypothetical protein